MLNASQRRNSGGGRIALAATLVLFSAGVSGLNPVAARAQNSVPPASPSNERLVSLELRDARLEAAIQALATSSGFSNFAFDSEPGKAFNLVTVKLTDQPLSRAVNTIASSAGAVVSYEDGIYHLRPRTEADSKAAPKPAPEPPVTAPAAAARVRRDTQLRKITLNFMNPSDFVKALSDPMYLAVLQASPDPTRQQVNRGTDNAGADGVRQTLQLGNSLLPQQNAPSATPATNPTGQTGGAGGSAGRDSGYSDQGAQGFGGRGFGGGGGGQGFGGGGQGFGGGGQGPGGGGGGQGPGGGQNGGFRASIPGIQNIYSNDSDNALLVEYDNVEDLNRLREIIRILDVKPRQVQIKAEFVAVTVNDADSFGIDWNITPAANLNAIIPPVAGGSGATSIVVAYASGNTVANLRAALTKSHSNILQAPIISTVNNKAATIAVNTVVSIAQQVVIPGSVNSTPLTTTFQQPITANNGLTVLPHINGDNSITLSLQPTLSSIVLRGDGGYNQTFDTLTTTRIIQSGETMVLGGFISKQDNQDTQKVPFLSDLPIIGNLFTQKSNSVIGTETLVFVTPTIIEDQSQGVVGTGTGSGAPAPTP